MNFLTRGLLPVLVVTAALGCGGGGAGAGKKLRVAASADLRCPEQQVTAFEPANYAGHARGCGREMLYLWNRREWVSPLARATFDLACPAESLTVVPISARTAGVSGCGKKATYVVGPTLEWVLNGQSSTTTEP